MFSPPTVLDEKLAEIGDDILSSPLHYLSQNESTEESTTSYFDDSEADPDYDIIKENFQPERFINLLDSPAQNKTNEVISDTDSANTFENIRSLPSELNSPSTSELSLPTTSRKRKLQPNLWKQNVRKTFRESGKQYTNINGKEFPAKSVKSPCKHTCFYLCTKLFSEQDGLDINQKFWTLTDNEKPIFYAKFVKRTDISRRRIPESNQKNNTFNFFLETNGSTNRVCRKFFLNTLDINEKRIYHFFKCNFDKKTGIPKPSKKGKNVKRITPEFQNSEIKEHIGSFPTIDSHYCRQSTEKKYLEQHLNLRKMYNLYKASYSNPASFDVYKKHFNYSFNLSFYKPKKDQCNLCVLYKMNIDPSSSEKNAYDTHIEEKLYLKAEKASDKSNTDPNLLILCADLQSVFPLPKGNASVFFYKRKLNVFNFTASAIVYNKPTITYCAIWNEAQSGRGGNDIASAIYKILKKCLLDNPDLNRIIIWSDSCVPQNKNKIMATASLQFLEENKNIKSIEQKFSVPGHSLIQEVDCVHSVIDKYLKDVEIPSPLTLLKLLKNINGTKTKLCILQLTANDFYQFLLKANKMQFMKVPFMKIKFIKYSNPREFIIHFKTSGKETEYTAVLLRHAQSLRNLGTAKNLFSQPLQNVPVVIQNFNKDKKNDIKSMLPYLPQEDQAFFKALLKF